MNLLELIRKHKNFVVLALIIISSTIALSVQSSRIVNASEHVGMSLTTGVQQMLSSTGAFFRNTIRSVGELRDLRREYNGLLEKLDENQKIVETIQVLEAENAQLRVALEYSRRSEFGTIPARIIAKDPGVLFNSYTINKGGNQGIAIGMPVLAYQDGEVVLAGSVIDVTWNSSLVRPLTDPASYVPGRLTRTRYEGLLSGLGPEESVLLMEYIDRESRNQISVGDEVITSGLGSKYPPGIRIGVVAAISANSYDTSLALEIIPGIQYSKLEDVFVITSQANNNPAPAFIPIQEGEE